MSLVVGLAINAAGEEAQPLLAFIKSVYAVVEKLLTAVFWYVSNMGIQFDNNY